MKKEDILKKLIRIKNNVSKKEAVGCRIGRTPFEAKLTYLGKYSLMLTLTDTESGFIYIELTKGDWALSDERLAELSGAIGYYMSKLGFEDFAEPDMTAIKEEYLSRLDRRYKRLLDTDL